MQASAGFGLISVAALLGGVLASAVIAGENPVPAAARTVPSTAATATELPGVSVKGKEDVLMRSDRRLADLKKSLPLLGTDRQPQVTYVERAAAYYEAHQDPNRLDVLQQETLLRLIGLDPLTSRPQMP